MTRRGPRATDIQDGGQIVPGVVVFLVALFVMASFMIDIGRAFNERREVRAGAAAAARAAAQGDPAALFSSAVFDEAAATARAQAVLDAEGLTGVVSFDLATATVTVTAHSSFHAEMPNLFGLDGRVITATVSAVAQMGATEGVSP